MNIKPHHIRLIALILGTFATWFTSTTVGAIYLSAWAVMAHATLLNRER